MPCCNEPKVEAYRRASIIQDEIQTVVGCSVARLARGRFPFEVVRIPCAGARSEAAREPGSDALKCVPPLRENFCSFATPAFRFSFVHKVRSQEQDGTRSAPRTTARERAPAAHQFSGAPSPRSTGPRAPAAAPGGPDPGPPGGGR